MSEYTEASRAAVRVFTSVVHHGGREFGVNLKRQSQTAIRANNSLGRTAANRYWRHELRLSKEGGQ